MHDELIARAAELLRSRTALGAPENPDPYCVLALFDADGYPTASTITAARADGIARLYFGTGLNSNKAQRIRLNPRASVCFAEAGYNITLVGAAEILTDAETKNALWYPGLANNFSGPGDPNFRVLSFKTERYNLFVTGSRKPQGAWHDRAYPNDRFRNPG